jgi:hypothetical protein
MAKRSLIDRIRPFPELRRRPVWAVAGLALFAAGVSVAAIPAGSSARNPRISAVRAYADAHVSVSAQDANYGKQRGLTVDARPMTRAYVRFGIDLEKGKVLRVNLLLYSRTRSQLGYQVRLATESWRERRITFENAPRVSPRYVSSGRLRARAWKAVDITSLVGKNGDEVNLALTTVAPAGIVFASRESGMTGPRLVVERDDRDSGKGKNPTTEPPLPLTP